MTNHPGRRSQEPRPSPGDLRSLRERSGLTQAQFGALVHATARTVQDWESGTRQIPLATMELLCLALAVGTVDAGPYVPPGDWMRAWVRYALLLWFRRPAAVA